MPPTLSDTNFAAVTPMLNRCYGPAAARWRGRDFESNRLADEFLKRTKMAGGRPDLELGVSLRLHLQHHGVALVTKLEAGDDLAVTAVEALRDAEDRCQQPDRSPQRGREVRVLLM